ncbi:MAG: hypothetical protein HN356_15695 [Calditrichaeota bacterium]|mgnify:CR=1|jgi:hypothetical protein|nr:hypothetical protein [Calditrichota bacterium]
MYIDIPLGYIGVAGIGYLNRIVFDLLGDPAIQAAGGNGPPLSTFRKV